MGLEVEEKPVEKIESSIPHKIILTFKDDVSVNLEMQMIGVSAPQIELAGGFLLRQANKFYKLQDELNQQKTVVVAPAGFDPGRLRG